MKVGRKGNIRLQRGDYRVGNFIFHEENNHIKVIAISDLASWRVSVETSVGMLIKHAIKEEHNAFLATYAAGVFSQLCVVPDPAFFEKHAKLINDQVNAHPEYYGKSAEPITKEEDDKIIEEEKELQEAVE